ncbi:MAG: histidine kinase [Gammaproteobacteria bacterium]|nr:histidine kinase [Gammaproteobacteria bacterium]
MTSEQREPRSFLPNFGSAVVAFRILLMAECIAIIITLTRNSEFNDAAWQDLLQVSSIAQLIAIGSIIILKLIGRPLQRLPITPGVLIAFVVLLLVAAIVTEAYIYALYKLEISAARWPDWHDSLLIRVLVITAVVGALGLRYSIVYRSAQIEKESKHSERLQALQSRIRPHFLFNSMNSVATLISIDPELAEKALQDLADVFRTLLADARTMVPVSAEGALARQYLNIEKLRLGDRLNVRWTASNVPRSAQLPSLTLQPLLENAVYHGIEPSFSGGTINVRFWCEDDYLNIVISNPLPEVTNQAQNRKGNKIALENVSERLYRHYGGRASLNNYEQADSYHVRVRVPIVKGRQG